MSVRIFFSEALQLLLTEHWAKLQACFLLIIMLVLCLERSGNRDYTLTLDCVTLIDDAEYTFVARNVLGEVKCKAQLFVEAKKG